MADRAEHVADDHTLGPQSNPSIRLSGSQQFFLADLQGVVVASYLPSRSR